MANFLQLAQKAAQFKGRMQELQERVRRTETSGAAGSVSCVMDGRFTLKSLDIGDAALAQLIITAVNDARDRAEKLMADETKKLMDDLGLPPGFDLPF